MATNLKRAMGSRDGMIAALAEIVPQLPARRLSGARAAQLQKRAERVPLDYLQREFASVVWDYMQQLKVDVELELEEKDLSPAAHWRAVQERMMGIAEAHGIPAQWDDDPHGIALGMPRLDL